MRSHICFIGSPTRAKKKKKERVEMPANPESVPSVCGLKLGSREVKKVYFSLLNSLFQHFPTPLLPSLTLYLPLSPLHPFSR